MILEFIWLNGKKGNGSSINTRLSYVWSKSTIFLSSNLKLERYVK